MNADEQKLLSGLFDRTRQAADTPRDPDAERFIVDQIKSQPSAPYLLAQAVIVQEHGLNACHERIQALEAQVKDLQNAPAAQPQSGGIFGSIFGGAQSPQSPQPSPSRFGGPWGGGAAPQDAYAPQAQPAQAGRWAAPPQQSQGGGFLQGALTTAAGVAGGALAFEGIKSMMGGNSLFGGSGGGTGGVPQSGTGETVVNNYYNDDKSTDAPNDYAQMDRLDDAYDDSLDNTDSDDDNVA